MVAWTVAAARDGGAEKIVVVDGPGRPLESSLDGSATIAVQEEPRGTADAVRAASDHLGREGTVIVLNGDGPLVRPETIAALAEAHGRSGAAATIGTAVLEDPSGYGRVIRAPDGTVDRVVETKTAGDASELELRVREVNTGLYAFDSGELLDALAHVDAQVTDALEIRHQLQGGGDEAQIGGHRLATRQHLQTKLVDLDLERVDLMIVADGGARQRGVALDEALARGGHHFFDARTHEQDALPHLCELVFVFPVRVPAIHHVSLQHGHQPNRPVM